MTLFLQHYRFIPAAMKNGRWYESLFCAPPPTNPARDTNGP
ncbi:hypothetical protein [Limobrevibacterium gyesilva]|nr:hypothetical protein [Limobrevibacterium gyesilva]